MKSMFFLLLQGFVLELYPGLLGALLLRPLEKRVVGPDDLGVSLVLPIVPVPVACAACAAPAGVCRGLSVGRVVAL